MCICGLRVSAVVLPLSAFCYPPAPREPLDNLAPKGRANPGPSWAAGEEPSEGDVGSARSGN